MSTPITHEAVINVSEGRRRATLEELAAAARDSLLDVHVDADHNRSVFTLGSHDREQLAFAARALAHAAWQLIDLQHHDGVHPRHGVVDVVPFVDLRNWHERGERPSADAIELREAFGRWCEEAGVAARRYGTDIGVSLPDVRRQLRSDPDSCDFCPERRAPRAGTTCVGARGPLVAYNVWVARPDDHAADARDVNETLAAARACVQEIRSSEVRALALVVGPRIQVSMNLVAPLRTGPVAAYQLVADALARHNAATEGAEVVGLIPADCVAGASPADLLRAGISSADLLEVRVAQSADERLELVSRSLRRVPA